MELGEQKPSHLLRRMRELARDKVNNHTLNILWQNHLPASVRAVLVVSDTKELNTLASIADKVMETVRPSGSGVDEVTSATSDSIIAEIAKLNKRLDRLTLSRSRRGFYRGRGRARFRSRSRRRQDSRHRSPARKDLCFYHAKYQEKAHRCVTPCAWKDEPGNSPSCSQQRWPAA
ncbi:uncharacterized protein LOC121733934 [Aricia agestis]|uniref:uncharacterized protein LOC121733934 n=1 Tax=Aricia agestis TaxID=91739 RepID=UPI001C208D3B|nr:uncharacterized protein LOC121733934 [Aricia agestis]